MQLSKPGCPDWKGRSSTERLGDLSRQMVALAQFCEARFNALAAQFSAIDFRFDAMDEKMDSRLRAMDQKVDSRFDAMDQKLDSRLGALLATVAGAWASTILVLFFHH